MINERFFENLNNQQKTAIFSNEKRVCVIAGPGCGKTKTLISKILLVLQNEKHSSILVLTFGKKAINEIKDRVSKIFEKFPNELKVLNIHSFCYEFLQKHFKMLDFSKEGFPNFNICDTDLQKNFLRKIINESDEVSSDEKNIFQILKDISLKKINVISKLDEKTEKIFLEYEKLMRRESFLDFADLLIYTLFLLKNNNVLRERYQKKFSHILVDEFQDINDIQWQIIKILNGGEVSKNFLFVVGDPNQCIYGFQGSVPGIIKSFNIDSSWKTYYLSVNYRSSGNIVGISNEFLDKNQKQLIQNKLISVKNEGEKIKWKKNFSTSEIVELVNYLVKEEGYKLNNIAVLYRSNYLSAWLEKELLNREIPYEILGAYKFLQRSEVKDTVAFIRSVINLENSSVLRILGLVENIGKKTINLLEEESLFSNLKIIDFLSNAFLDSGRNKSEDAISSFIKSRKKISSIRNFTENFNEIKDKFDEKNETLFIQTKNMLEKFGYLNYLENKFGEEKLMNVKQFLNIIKKWEEENNTVIVDFSAKEKAKRFLDYLFLSFSESGQNEDDFELQRLTISNIHQVKGLEFDVILFVYLDEGIIPSAISTNKEEEKRIFYVGITRAKDVLYLISTNSPSIFLSQIENFKNLKVSF